ncbi:hypothetical protein AVV40_gp14 [Mycobacterium phage Swirley]|uniref:Uncharacterized protein n=3 Tax=Benedictvirus TaxID=2946819 RepID=A0A0N9RUP4_9CAUD|nr:hypothetical protein AVV40_gp14 [Mycobacterium phage Swirley]YP_009214352.1 hypothetical protein AVU87_gp13 [Mycobacterium phage Theia]YP_009638166.1 hypothetical protein FGG35_gp14 [Mycobacterium phage Cuco]AVR76659.1 hypothetical protein SEA_COOG_77 [Mycobacterium phage Coog]AVR77204.1 hypothetical protein SEA_MIDAS2_77 [Mycobacterium phage Midas2]AXC33354.1 hypothetical protein SEA_DUBLIN_80 [Mycobacterium phage Dublin]QGJ92252.1 hypothetical protein SEA_MARYSWELL_80 [Mycobacterium phag
MFEVWAEDVNGLPIFVVGGLYRDRAEQIADSVRAIAVSGNVWVEEA